MYGAEYFHTDVSTLPATGNEVVRRLLEEVYRPAAERGELVLTPFVDPLGNRARTPISDSEIGIERRSDGTERISVLRRLPNGRVVCGPITDVHGDVIVKGGVMLSV